MDRIFYSGDNIEYVATNTIRTSNNVELHPQSSVVFIAENKIILSEGFKAHEGCYFNAKIESGSPFRTPHEFSEIEYNNSSSSKDDNFDFTFSVFPNPATDIITIRIEADSSMNASINIYNIEGKNVLKVLNNQRIYKISNIILDISPFQAGIYYCVLKTNNRKKTIQLIKS